ncbi:MAG TPA: GntR family transcriptional regulator [Clostridia bacterium]|nr:GntR family transcriptional regulator [Clostridia bacterium]
MTSNAAFFRSNLCSVVAGYIKGVILEGIYREGDHVFETEVAKALGISRATIREGIKELEKEGILTIIPRKGTFITRYTAEDIKEIFDIRRLFENDILELLISENKLSEKDFTTLEVIVKDMVMIVDSAGDSIKKAIMFNDKDMEFHRYIWEKSGSRRRVEILERLYFQLKVAMFCDTHETGDLMIKAADHYEIIKCLRSNNLENCKKTLSNHITIGERRKL